MIRGEVEKVVFRPFVAFRGVLACGTMSTRVGVGVLLLSTFLFFTANAQGSGSDHHASEAADLLSHASEQVGIESPESPPFMLLAKVRLQEGNKSTDGLYALAWAPGRFRRVFRFPNFTETDVMVDGSMYRQRSTNFKPLVIYELDTLMNSVLTIRPDSKSKLRKMDKALADVNCVSVVRDTSETQICLTSATLLPVSIDRSLDLIGLPTPGVSVVPQASHNITEMLQEHYEMGDYQAFGSKQFPRTLRFHAWKSTSINAKIDKLIKVQSFPADEFVPPVGSTQMHFCDAPEIVGDVRPYAEDAGVVRLRDTELTMYFQVSPVGSVRSAEVVYSTNPVMNKEILNWFVGTHFPVRSCAGQPVEYETIVTLAAGH
jgi:hypothetical protein